MEEQEVCLQMKESMDKQIILNPIYHRGIECTGIYFGIDPEINGALKKTKAARG
jgi:hypothetical protein